MNCQKFEHTASAYLDRELGDTELLEFREHLPGCSYCRLRLKEIEQVSLLFKETPKLAAPEELRGYVLTEVVRQSTMQISIGQRFFEWLLRLNPRPVSYTAGFLISLVSFLALFSSFKPIPTTAASVRRSPAVIDVIRSSGQEFSIYNDLATPSASAGIANYYEMPRVLDDGALVNFSHMAYERTGSHGMAALVEVETDGSAKLVDILDASQDPYLVEQLWWSLGARTFKPAFVSGRPVTTRIILLVEKVDVRG
jgi:hypothetical protein